MHTPASSGRLPVGTPRKTRISYPERDIEEAFRMQSPLSRREFLARTAVAGVALGVGRRVAAAPNTGMFVSLNSSLVGKVDWPAFAQLAAQVGYGGTDVSLDGVKREGAEATRTLFKNLNIRPGILGLPVRFTADEAAFQEGLKQLGDAAALAAAIDCPRMQTVMPPSSATPKEEYRKIIKDRVVAMAEVLQKSKVRLGLEFLGPLHFRARQPHEFIWKMDELLAFAKECAPNVGLVLDAWHWHHAGATAADIIAAGKSRIVTVHVSDAKQQPAEEVRDNQRLMPGEGVIDLTTFFKSLQKIGYADAVSPEPIGRVPPTMTPEEGARLGLETTVAVMKRAGVKVERGA
jgi:sugar phosphate isomerase/epimerase